MDCQVWYSSPTVDEMTGEQVKAYLYLLCRAWLSEPMGYLPNDDDKLARIAKVTPQEWQAMRDSIMCKFVVVDDDPSFIYNEKQMQLVMELHNKKKAGASGWTDARKRIMAHVARQNGKKHKAGTKAGTKANATL